MEKEYKQISCKSMIFIMDEGDGQSEKEKGGDGAGGKERAIAVTMMVLQFTRSEESNCVCPFSIGQLPLNSHYARRRSSGGLTTTQQQLI